MSWATYLLAVGATVVAVFLATVVVLWLKELSIKKLEYFEVTTASLKGNQVRLPNRGRVCFDHLHFDKNMGSIEYKGNIACRRISVAAGTNLTVKGTVFCKQLMARGPLSLFDDPVPKPDEAGTLTADQIDND